MKRIVQPENVDVLVGSKRLFFPKKRVSGTVCYASSMDAFLIQGQVALSISFSMTRCIHFHNEWLYTHQIHDHYTKYRIHIFSSRHFDRRGVTEELTGAWVKVDVKKRLRYLGAGVGRYGEELVKEQEVVRGRGLGCVKIYRGAGTCLRISEHGNNEQSKKRKIGD